MGRHDLEELARTALEEMLICKPVAQWHPPDWQRPPNWPVPIGRELPGLDGGVIRYYRPIEVLAWVDEQIQVEAAAIRMREQQAAILESNWPAPLQG